MPALSLPLSGLDLEPLVQRVLDAQAPQPRTLPAHDLTSFPQRDEQSLDPAAICHWIRARRRVFLPLACADHAAADTTLSPREHTLYGLLLQSTGLLLRADTVRYVHGICAFPPPTLERLSPDDPFYTLSIMLLDEFQLSACHTPADAPSHPTPRLAPLTAPLLPSPK